LTLYAAVLFIHLVCVLGLFVALCFEWVSLSRMRSARTLDEFRTWINPVPSLPMIAMSSLLLILITGIYLTMQLQVWMVAWPKVAFITVLLIAPFGAVTGARMRKIRQAIAQTPASDVIALRKSVSGSVFGLSLGIRTWVVLGIVLIMAAKPSLNVCLVILVVAALIGVFSGRSIGSHAVAEQRPN
jgi:hypothetical protein